MVNIWVSAMCSN